MTSDPFTGKRQGAEAGESADREARSLVEGAVVMDVYSLLSGAELQCDETVIAAKKGSGLTVQSNLPVRKGAQVEDEDFGSGEVKDEVCRSAAGHCTSRGGDVWSFA